MVMMFAPVAIAHVNWTGSVRAANTNQVVEVTMLRFRVTGYRCNCRPNLLILSEWGLSPAANEFWQW
ncbi:hypothetical protein GQ600_24131 [Phytophthora cactorum]|nr:hypothetical protein GQ600_24131 [Phytophthora cactorum]